ncbi:hypothetical protein MMB232_00196 [Brevundimonas subvibrioides]|uniref:KGGVGR-motif variant AAA ATPase n=1 Tax=Brevundimonas subvibrioides TaxID=74313 RepID=UPI0032D57135
MVVRFDDSLSVFVEELARHVGASATNDAAIIRDGTGRLSAVLTSRVEEANLSAASTAISKILGGYARSDGLIRTADSYSGERLLAEAENISPILIGDHSIRFIDRRIVGADWLVERKPTSQRALRLAFASLKGGVGRSTALCVVAAHLSLAGFRVLTIDLDLEAPGIGTMLVSDEEQPNFGVVDYLVENNLSGTDPEFLNDLVANSVLGSGGARVSVVPAFGRSTYDHPDQALSKLSRAYVEDIDQDGNAASVGRQISEMVDLFDQDRSFDVILIDGRAGLHEISASIFLQLGAELLLFGTDQPQTYSGYRLLLSHLSKVAPGDSGIMERIRFVHARSSTMADELGRQKRVLRVCTIF